MSRPCKVSRLYADMPEQDRGMLRELIQDRSYSGLDIAKILKTAGYVDYKINRHAVEHFRRNLEAGNSTL